MSAALQTTFAPVTLLDQLSNAVPTAADLRARAAFWQRYLESTPGLAPDQVERLEASCVALLARADQMDAPAPVVTLVPRTTRTKADKSASVRTKPPAMTAERFWSMHTLAVDAIRAAHGDNWYSHAPLESVVLTVPAKLCSMTGPLGGKIKWRRDWRMPAGKYWPSGALPDCGLEIAPAPVDQGPLPGAGVAEMVAEQILRDKRFWIVASARARHAQALCGALKISAGLSRGRYPRALWLEDAATVRRELAAALFDWKVSAGLVDGAEYGVDAERDLAGGEVTRERVTPLARPPPGFPPHPAPPHAPRRVVLCAQSSRGVALPGLPAVVLRPAC